MPKSVALCTLDHTDAVVIALSKMVTATEGMAYTCPNFSPHAFGPMYSGGQPKHLYRQCMRCV